MPASAKLYGLGMPVGQDAALAGLRLTFVDEVDDVLRGSAGEEDFRNAGLFESRDIGFGDDTTDKDGNVVHAFFV